MGIKVSGFEKVLPHMDLPEVVEPICLVILWRSKSSSSFSRFFPVVNRNFSGFEFGV